MKATGEIMAIDATFGSALNKALRGLEQAGAGPLAEDPSWLPTFDYLGAVYGGWARKPTPRTSRSAGSTSPVRRASRRASRSAPRRRSCCAGFLPVRQPPVAAHRPAPPRRPGTDDRRGDRHLAVVRGGDGAQRAARGGRHRGRSAHRGTARDPEAAELLATTKRAGFGDRELAGLAGVTPEGSGGAAGLGLRPGYAMVDTCAAEFAAETPYFYSTYAAAGSAPEAPPWNGRRPSSSAADRCASGRGSSSTTARFRPRTRCALPAGRP